MGNIVNDIVDEVNIKPNKSKQIIKIIISIALACIGIAFAFGQFKSSFFNKMDGFEVALNKNTASIESIKTDISSEFQKVNARIDKGYTDGLETLQDYQEFNKKQLILVLDYGQTNKGLLKEMLEINMQEKSKSIENQVNESRNEPIPSNYQSSISVQRVEDAPAKPKEYYGMAYFISVENNDTTIQVNGATQDFINNIDKSKYEVGAKTDSKKYPGRYDVSYRNK